MKNQLKVALFCADITPPIGTPLAYVPNDKVDSPIFVRGIVIDDGLSRAVWATADIIYYWGKAYFQTRALIAKAAQTTPSKVFLHAIHQHDSMRFALELNDFYKRFNTTCIPPDYYQQVNKKLQQAIQTAVQPRRGNWQPVCRLSTAEKRIAGLASNRRLLDKNDKCYAMRFSMCTDKKMKQQPVGIIDPILRTVAFHADGNRLIAALHFYASHPMGAYLRNKVGADIPGVAIDYVTQHTDPRALHLYFNGCGGNITFGKYHLNSDKTISVLGKKLGDYLLANIQGLDEKPMGPLTFKTARFDFPLNPKMNETQLAREVEKAQNTRQMAGPGMRLTICRNRHQWSKPSVARMSIGPELHLLSLPGETVVEYQLYAQALIPEQFLAVAAYGNGTYHYIPTAEMFDQGGYEPDSGAICTREVEPRYQKAIAEVLRPLQ